MNIEYYRGQIDKIDRQLLELLNRRFRYTREIGKLKKNSGIEVHDPEREEKVLEALLRSNDGPLPHCYLQDIFATIISMSKKLQQY